jgi:hypothetical protein
MDKSALAHLTKMTKGLPKDLHCNVRTTLINSTLSLQNAPAYMHNVVELPMTWKAVHAT